MLLRRTDIRKNAYDLTHIASLRVTHYIIDVTLWSPVKYLIPSDYIISSLINSA